MRAEPPDDNVRQRLAPHRIPRLFLHFFDTHFLEEKGVARIPELAFREARLATRFAVMLADEIVVPGASYIESPLCARVLNEFDPEEFGTQIILTGSGSNVDEFIEEKQPQYHQDQAQGRVYRTKDIIVPFPWRPRGRSATSDIITDWRADLASGATEDLFQSIYAHLPRRYEKRWEALPDRLGKRAFILENILPHLFGRKREVPITVRNRLHAVVNRSYFGSYARDNFGRDVYAAGAAVFRNMAYLESPGPVPSGDPEHDVDFRALERACRQTRILQQVTGLPAPKLLELRDDPRFAAACVRAMPPLLDLSSGDGRPSTRRVGSRVLLAAAGRPESTEDGSPHAPKVLLVTALPHEAAAVIATLDGPVKTSGRHDDPVIYHLGAYVTGEGRNERHVLLATLSAMGTDNAAAVATHALRTFPSIEHVVMVGIAGGCPNPDKPDEHVRLGDVVVSNEKGVFDYGHVKRTSSEDTYRSAPQLPSARMLQSFRALMTGELTGQRPWEDHLTRALNRPNLSTKFARPTLDLDVLHASPDAAAGIIPHPHDPHRRPGVPKVHGGAIGTADILNKAPELRDELRDTFGVRAIEMEGSGVQTAGWMSGRDIMVVRGICDYCDAFKNDTWQHYAALAAAAYTRALVEMMPEEWFR